MLTSLEIDNFKCFRHLTIEPLAKVNLFVGTSNVGKTSVLEAVSWLPHQPKNLNLTAFRDKSGGARGSEEFGRWLVHNSTRVIRKLQLSDGDQVTLN